MTSADTRVNDLVVNVMTDEQFEKITPQDNQLYLVPSTDKEIKFMAPYIANMALSEYDTQEVVDARNFIYSLGDVMTIDLDLPTNTYLKRLVANGNINKLLKLNSVIVSPEAPFDSTTSPQINVSYTGLNRAALVNLFKSMPYNVGYTAVGSPTITDGVASGFSDSNYLRTTQDFPQSSNPFEMVFKVKFTAVNTTQVLFVSNQNLIVAVSGQGHFRLQAQYQNSAWTYSQDGVYSVPVNTDLYIKVLYDGAVFKLSYSTNGISFTDDITISTSTLSFQSGYCLMGTRGSQPLLGSIDLNETYIKINGVPWFTGKAATTKTCDVRGCTGTAELTQEDKNIALNNGWELTVA